MFSFIIKSLCFFASLISFKSASRAGEVIGLFLFYVVRLRRKVVLNNLSIALPDQREKHYNIAKCSYKSFGANIVEFLHLSNVSKMSKETVLDAMKIDGWNNYTRALAKGKGVIVVTAHIGNFDMLASASALKGVSLGIVSKDLSNSSINSYWMKIREGYGVKIFKSTDARGLLKWLKDGNVLGLVTDQRIGESMGGIMVPFFGRNVWTSPAAANLASHTGAVLLPVVSHRVAPGKHEMLIETPLNLSFDRTGKVDITSTMTSVNRQLEKWIKKYPCSWMWLHKRFKNSLNL